MPDECAFYWATPARGQPAPADGRVAAAEDESLDYIDRLRARVDPYGWLGGGLDPSLDVLFNTALNQEPLLAQPPTVP